MTVGERIHARRKELGMTLDDITKKTGIPKSTVQRWESGAIRNMGQESLRKVAIALDTSVNYLQTGVEVSVQFFPHQKPISQDVFDYLGEQSHYTFATHLGKDRYYASRNSSEFVLVDEKTIRKVLDEVSLYFGYLMHQRAIPLDEFMKLEKESE